MSSASLLRSLSSTAAVLVAALPAQGELGIPPPRKPAQPAVAAPRPETELQRFRRDLVEMQNPAPKVEARLQEIGLQYPQLESLMLEVARTARANEMQNLMVVARRFGTPKVGDELLFQLLARPLAEATRPTVETMALLQGDGARKALQECIRGRIAGVRRAATEVLAKMVQPEDMHFAMQLSGDQSLDLQLRGVDLLRALGEDRACLRLVELLSKQPALAAYACEALIGLGNTAAPHLVKLCNEPPIDRGWAYAAFALAQIERGTGRRLLDESWQPALTDRLRDPEPVTRSLVAVPLADLAYRSAGGASYPDTDIVERLLDVVEPQGFVSNLDMLRQPSEQRLLLLTGRLPAGVDGMRWRDWWKTQSADFLGMRADVVVAPETAGKVIVTLRRDQRAVRLIGEDLADLQPLDGAFEVLLTREQMLALAAALRSAGWGEVERFRDASGLPVARSLQVQVAGARAQVAVPNIEHPAFDALAQIVQERLEAEAWQLFRHPTDEPDRAAFWRAERRWRDENSDELERARRFARRIVNTWQTLPVVLRTRGLAYLFSHPQRQQLLGPDDGARILALLGRTQEFGESELRLLELAAGVPGDKVWRDCVDFAARQGGELKAVRAVFAVLGPEAVLAALADERPAVRRAAVDEVVAVRDLRAGPRLVELLADADPNVQMKAAYAVGQLQFEPAAAALIGHIAAPETMPLLRRECLRSLGRVGGPQAFSVLERALSAPEQEDKDAALRGLGELRDPRSSHLLAELAVIGHGKDLGALARYYLQRQGGVLAVPALRHQMQAVRDVAIRRQLVLLLGLYQDPQVVPDLMDMLRDPGMSVEAATLLSCTTGVDLLAAEDRVGAMDAWWRQNRALPQWRWLLDGLRAAKVATTLREEQFVVERDPAAIEELARLLVEAKEARFAVLAAAVLRGTTREDFGVVSINSPRAEREGIAARYRLLAESARAAQGR